MVRIESVGEMRPGETRTFAFAKGGKPAQGFLLRHGGGFSAYLNQCRHWPVSLDLGDGDFFYAAINRISCKTHGATYDPETGFCDSGPCAGASLTRFEVEVRDGHAYVSVPEDS